jgi:hypothetical protein
MDALTGTAKLNAPVEIGIEACNPVHLAKAAYWKRARLTWEMLAGKA